MRKLLTIIVCICTWCSTDAQYAPQAGLPGSTAISASSAQIIGWATGCTVQRGLQDIANPLSGYATLGDSSQAIGSADLGVVSLGDSGVAVLTFAHPIVDQPGPDFVVFENGFVDPANDSMAFLELAFVEVSSDGVNYVRFPANSLTQTTTQIANGNYMNAAGLNNLAGKYVGNYGTPFDLQELADKAGLDINNITHVRLIDVVGSIGAHASHDSAGRAINDPYPTAFPSCGFDLDAVGVIHQSGTSVGTVIKEIPVRVYPNPATDKLVVDMKSAEQQPVSVAITSVAGNVLQRVQLSQSLSELHVGQYPAGMYYLVFSDNNGMKWVERVTKR